MEEECVVSRPVKFHDNEIAVSFYCKLCTKEHIVTIPNEVFDTNQFPISYAYVHGDPMVMAMLYIDAKKQVRGIEFSDEVGFTEDQLQQILLKSKNITLTSIPQEHLYGFELFEKKNLKKVYYKPGYEKIIDLSNTMKMWKNTQKFVQNDEMLEFFLKFNKMWIGGMKILDYTMLMAVDTSIDIDHFKTQMMAIFETIAS